MKHGFLQKRISLDAAAAHVEFQSGFCVTCNMRCSGGVKSRETEVYQSGVAEYKTDVCCHYQFILHLFYWLIDWLIGMPFEISSRTKVIFTDH